MIILSWVVMVMGVSRMVDEKFVEEGVVELLIMLIMIDEVWLLFV